MWVFSTITNITRFWLVPGVSQTLHCVRRSASFPLFTFPACNLVLLLTLLLLDVFIVTTFVEGGGSGGGKSLSVGGGGVISVLVDVATNICGLDLEATSPSGRGIGFIFVEKEKKEKDI